MQKTFLVSSIVSGVALLLFAVYNMAFRTNVYESAVENVQDIKKLEFRNSLDETFSDKKTVTVKTLSNERAMHPYFDSNENAVWFFSPETREIKKVSVDTGSIATVMSLSGSPLRAVWAPAGRMVLAELDNASGSRWYLIDVGAQNETPLKDGIETPTWSTLGDRIAYKYYDAATKKRSISTADPDGTHWKDIAESPFRLMESFVAPKGSLLFFWNRGTAFEETSLRSVSLVGGEVKTVFGGKFGADYVFSPDGEKILMSSTKEKGGQSVTLGLLLHQGTQYQNLLIPTLATKATWSRNGKFVYYALPGSIPDGAVLPDEYFAKPFFTQDTLWKVNIETGEKTRIVDPKELSTGYDVSFLAVNDGETALVFVNRTDGKLYGIDW
jgi:Tol biopolymer transport system component